MISLGVLPSDLALIEIATPCSSLPHMYATSLPLNLLNLTKISAGM